MAGRGLYKSWIRPEGGATFNSNGMTKHRTITEEFADPDYPFEFETIRRVEAAGFKLDRRFGNFWVYTLNFRRDAALEYPE